MASGCLKVPRDQYWEVGQATCSQKTQAPLSDLTLPRVMSLVSVTSLICLTGMCKTLGKWDMALLVLVTLAGAWPDLGPDPRFSLLKTMPGLHLQDPTEKEKGIPGREQPEQMHNQSHTHTHTL